jgi:hypothetical protein
MQTILFYKNPIALNGQLHKDLKYVPEILNHYTITLACCDWL